MNDKISINKIKRHLEDHPGYYHEEREIRFLIDLLDTERTHFTKQIKELNDKMTEMEKSLLDLNTQLDKLTNEIC